MNPQDRHRYVQEMREYRRKRIQKRTKNHVENNIFVYWHSEQNTENHKKC